MLAQAVRRQRWSCLAYCLMHNHIHLLVETPQPNLGAGMQRLHGLYAQTFNKRHKRCGHLFQGRYGGDRVRTDEQLLTAARYIALNPVEAGLCERPDEWPWSSHAGVLEWGGAGVAGRGPAARRTSACAAATRAAATPTSGQMMRSSLREQADAVGRVGGDVGARCRAGLGRERGLQGLLVVEVELA